MRLKNEDTIGVAIDLQDRLLSVMNDNEKLIHSCSILTKGLLQLNIPLFFTQQYTKGLGETTEQIKSLVENFNHIEKKEFSCWNEPEFKLKIQKSHAKNIILFGIESHICVLQTAIDLKEEGYNPIVVMDCVSSRRERDILLAEKRLHQENIITTSCEAILFELLGTAENPNFKAISNLIK
ncbi:MAG: isochorismatase family protein [Prolixibacteraceae bacterium]|nr:isochorismatase family protein [Prolixibacteraceae bacterium]